MAVALPVADTAAAHPTRCPRFVGMRPYAARVTRMSGELVCSIPDAGNGGTTDPYEVRTVPFEHGDCEVGYGAA